MDEAITSRIGISAIATYEPPWVLGNDWFGDTIPRKFVHHTGIESRPISLEDEVTMGVRAVRNLQREDGLRFERLPGGPVRLAFVRAAFRRPASARSRAGRARTSPPRGAGNSCAAWEFPIAALPASTGFAADIAGRCLSPAGASFRDCG